MAKRIVILEICDCAMCPYSDLSEQMDILETGQEVFEETCRCSRLQNTMTSSNGEFPVPVHCPLPLKGTIVEVDYSKLEQKIAEEFSSAKGDK